MGSTDSKENDKLREIAHSLGCLVPSEIQALTGWSDSTLEAYRKRGKGPSFVKAGKHYLYPRSGVAEFMTENTRARLTNAKGLL